MSGHQASQLDSGSQKHVKRYEVPVASKEEVRMSPEEVVV